MGAKVLQPADSTANSLGANTDSRIRRDRKGNSKMNSYQR